MNRVQSGPLRDLLCQQSKELREEAIRTGGQISAQQVEALERLARLVSIFDAAHPPTRRKWPMATALGVTLLIVSVLLFARVSETEIELELRLSEASFVSPTQQILIDMMPLSAIGVSGLREIQLPRSPDRPARALRASDGVESAIRLSVASDRQREGTITLPTLALPAGTRSWLRSTETPNQFRLSLKGLELPLRAEVSGPIRMGLSDEPVEQIDFSSPASFLLQPGSNEVDLDLTLPAASQGTFHPQLSATDISFTRIEQFMDNQRTIVRRASTILAGTLYLESLDGRARQLRSGEAISFDSIHGEIRTLRFEDKQLALSFHGFVHGMTNGADGSSRSLMPTYLEWLQARHGLSLLWGTTLYLFGLFAGALRWWEYQL